MRRVIDGNGNDSTAAVLAWLKGGNQFRLATLYLIGEPDDPYALWLTDWESPLLWAPWGTFQPAVITRGTVSASVGLEVTTLDVEWSPKNVTPGNTVPTSSPYQLARIGFYDNWTFRSWTVFMPVGEVNISQVDVPSLTRYYYALKVGSPALKTGMILHVGRMEHPGNNGTFRLLALQANPLRFQVLNPAAVVATETGRAVILPGDAASFGAAELFGGRIGKSVVGRGSIKFTANSFLDVVNQQVPINVIEQLNTLAPFMGAVPPTGLSVIPQFDAINGSDITVVGDCTTPTPHQIFAANKFRNGFLVFRDVPGSSLGRMWAAVQSNKSVTISATNYNQFTLYQPLPYPVSGTDSFFVSGTPPLNKLDGDYLGFPYVPAPEQAT